MSNQPVSIRSQRRPGDLGLIVWLHGVGYTQETGNHFGPDFEGYVADTISEFQLGNHGAGTLFFAERSGGKRLDDILGCAALVDRSSGDHQIGQLRWVVVRPQARGLGLGRRLVEAVIGQSKRAGHRAITLETTTGLDASMALYERLGFVVTDISQIDMWGSEQTLIRMQLDF